MDMLSTITQAGGIGAIAQQLGIDEGTAQSGLSSLLPEVTSQIENKGLPPQVGGAPATEPMVDPSAAMADGGGLGGMRGGLLGGAGAGSLGEMFGGSGGMGNQILSHIFGSKDVSRDVAADAAQKSGVDASILRKMLPIVAGMVAMHFMTHRGQASVGEPQQGGAGGMLGSILGGLGGR